MVLSVLLLHYIAAPFLLNLTPWGFAWGQTCVAVPRFTETIVTTTVCSPTAMPVPTSTCNPTAVTLSPALPSNVSISQCHAGHAQCCDSVVAATHPSAAFPLHILGVAVQGSGLVGLNCTSITVPSDGSGTYCDAKPLCCQSDYPGIIAVGCTPINLNVRLRYNSKMDAFMKSLGPA